VKGNGRGDTRGQIYAATERLLEEVPLHELSVAQIIEHAGVSRATFYFYCSSKFAVVEGLLTQIMDEIYDVARPFIDRADDEAPDAALRRSLEASAALWRKHRFALRAVSEHWNTVPELRSLWLGVVRKFTDGVAAEVERQRAAGIAPPGVPTAQVVLALLWATERSFYVAGLGVDPGFAGEEDAVAALYAIWHGAIYGARVIAFDS
jgi:AcrR family transcriptional regulator